MRKKQHTLTSELIISENISFETFAFEGADIVHALLVAHIVFQAFVDIWGEKYEAIHHWWKEGKFSTFLLKSAFWPLRWLLRDKVAMYIVRVEAQIFKTFWKIYFCPPKYLEMLITFLYFVDQKLHWSHLVSVLIWFRTNIWVLFPTIPCYN